MNRLLKILELFTRALLIYIEKKETDRSAYATPLIFPKDEGPQKLPGKNIIDFIIKNNLYLQIETSNNVTSIITRYNLELEIKQHLDEAIYYANFLKTKSRIRKSELYPSENEKLQMLTIITKHLREAKNKSEIILKVYPTASFHEKTILMTAYDLRIHPQELLNSMYKNDNFYMNFVKFSKITNVSINNALFINASETNNVISEITPELLDVLPYWIVFPFLFFVSLLQYMRKK